MYHLEHPEKNVFLYLIFLGTTVSLEVTPWKNSTNKQAGLERWTHPEDVVT